MVAERPHKLVIIQDKINVVSDLFRYYGYCHSLDGATLFSEVDSNKFVRPRWPYDMRPSARGEKYMCVIVIR